MMRQSPKPYAKGKVRRTPPRPRSRKYCQARRICPPLRAWSTREFSNGVGHLWGLSPTSHPFVLLAGQPVSIRYGELPQPHHRFYLSGIR